MKQNARKLAIGAGVLLLSFQRSISSQPQQASANLLTTPVKNEIPVRVEMTWQRQK